MNFHSIHIAGPPQASHSLLWGHGWGQTGASFRPLAEALAPFVPSTLLDLPGFGATQAPPSTWGTAEYADAVSEWIASQRSQLPLIWVGHSFGGRVGVQLAARQPQTLNGLILIAAAGLQRRRSPLEKLKFDLRRTVTKSAGRLLAGTQHVERLRNRMGSADYRRAGALRPIFTRVVAEDLSSQATQVQCPTLLIYGRNDTETPVEFGERYQSLIPGSELSVLEGFGHLDILNEGRHQVSVLMRRFLQTLALTQPAAP